MNATLRRRLAAAALALAPILSSCGFAQPTDLEYTPGVGVNERSGTVDVLHALVVSDEDGAGTLVTTLVNNWQEEADALTGVSGGAEGVSVLFSGALEVPPSGVVQVHDETTVVVEGEAVRAGYFIPLTMTFAGSESVTLQVPVVERSSDYANVPTPGAEPTEFGSDVGTGDPTGVGDDQ